MIPQQLHSFWFRFKFLKNGLTFLENVLVCVLYVLTQYYRVLNYGNFYDKVMVMLC